MFRVLKKARIPLFLRRKSNHIFTVWQHLVLLVVRQYENKSYRNVCRMVDRSILPEDISPIITYSALYYSSEIHR